MKFHRLKDVSLSSTDFVCRDAVWPKVVMTLLGVVVFGTALAAIFVTGGWRAPAPVRYIIAPAFALFMLLWTWICGADLLKAWGPQNWLLRQNLQGLWIKFRSFANAHFSDEDEVVLQLEHGDIEWIGPLRECVIRPGPGEGRAQQWEWVRHLQIGLSAKTDLSEIDRRLREERDRNPPPGRIQTKVLDYPVRLIDNSILRIEWKSSRRRAKPSLARAIKQLETFGEIREMPERVIDLSKPAPEKNAMEGQIIELLERGDRIAAIKLARKCYRCSLSEAERVVQDLSA